MQPNTDTESEIERKDEKTPLVANGIEEGTLCSMSMGTYNIIKMQLWPRITITMAAIV